LSTTKTLSSRPKMVEELNSGTSINNLWLSEPDIITNPSTSTLTEDHQKSEFTQLTLTGGRSSGTEEATSSTFRTKRFLMYPVEKIKKDKRLLSGTDITELTRDGQLSMLIRQRRLLLRDTINNSVSTWADHSISDQECQWEESLNA
jgi:hypothetical protein